MAPNATSFCFVCATKWNLRNEILLLWDEKNPKLVLNDTDLSLGKLNKSVLGIQSKQRECNSLQGVRWPFVQLRDRFSKALHPRYTKCKHPAPGPDTSVGDCSATKKRGTCNTHSFWALWKEQNDKNCFHSFFCAVLFSFACHGQGPMETHRLLHNSYYFPQNPIFHLKTAPQKGSISVAGGRLLPGWLCHPVVHFQDFKFWHRSQHSSESAFEMSDMQICTAEGRLKIFTMFPLHTLNPPPPFDTQTACARGLQDSCTENKAWRFPKLWLQICLCPPQCVHEQHSMSHCPLLWKASCNMDVAVMDLSEELCSDFFWRVWML